MISVTDYIVLVIRKRHKEKLKKYKKRDYRQKEEMLFVQKSMTRAKGNAGKKKLKKSEFSVDFPGKCGIINCVPIWRHSSAG